MLKNNSFTKAVSMMVIGSFVLVLPSKQINAQMLTPVSFSQMYYLAQNGEVEALRGSVRRGLNIDVMNRNGDTGLCIAARRRDSYTYNAFRAAGANPRHPCTQTIEGYEEFVNSARTTPIGSTSRAAYGMMGKEAYTMSSWVWWAGGAALIGGGVAVGLSGGGGGGGDAPAPTPVVNKIDSAGRYLAQSGVAAYVASSNEQKTNSADLSLSNDKTDIIKTMNFNSDVTNNGRYLNVVLKAVNGGEYANNSGADITANSGVVAMSAYNGGKVFNEGALKVTGENAAIGMLAGDRAEAWNSGTASNGIHLTFTGDTATDTIIGMYGDAGSNIINNGLVSGTASLVSGSSSTATKGSMTGMEIMIVNANTDSMYTTSSATNSGNIDLAAGQNSTGSDESVEVSLIGMGTYLDNGFLNGSKNINRGEKAVITNNNTINLSYLGKYSSADDYLRQGTGGIVGMKADANGTATNKNKINVTMSTTVDTGNYAVAAGMQSVHGGNILNDTAGDITFTTGATDNRIAYGMMAAEGSGTVSGLYTISPVVTNNGKINMQISNGYGMATYAGGTLENKNKIVLGKEVDDKYTNNIGMYGNETKKADIKNSGTIQIYSSKSVGMQSDFSGGTAIVNDGTIIIEKSATESHPFAGNYSSIVNKGIVDYKTTNTTGTTEGTFPDSFTFGLKDAVINTDGSNTLSSGSGSGSGSGSNTSSGSSGTVSVTNESGGVIKLTGSSYTAAIANNSALGSVINKGNIEIYEDTTTTSDTLQSVGIYVSDAAKNGSSTINDGTITVNTKYSGGIVSDQTDAGVYIKNNAGKNITMSGENSVGMYASGTASIYNDGTVRVGKNSYAIIAKGNGIGAAQQKIYNNGVIELAGEGATGFYVGKASTAVIESAGIIKVVADNVVGFRIDIDETITVIPDIEGDSEYFKTFIYYDVGGTLTISLTDTSSHPIYGTFARVLNGGTVVNNSNFETGAEGAIIFRGLAGSTIKNNGILTAKHLNSYAIKSAGTVENGADGKIYVTSPQAYGIYSENSTSTAENKGEITVSSNATDSYTGGYGMYGMNNAKIANSGTITVSGNGKDKADSSISSGPFGMYVSVGGEATNSNIINVSGYDAHGMWAASDSKIINDENGKININNTENKIAYGMVAMGANSSAENAGAISAISQYSQAMYTNIASLSSSGTITASGNNSRGMYVTGSAAKATNFGTITSSGANSYGMIADNGASITNSSSAGSGSSATSAGIINVSSSSAFGMYVTDVNTKAVNSGEINVSANEAIGIYAKDKANVTVSAGSGSGSGATSGGTINVSASEAIGISATGEDTIVTNAGEISVSASVAKGIRADSSASVTNAASGTITVSASEAIGISVTGNKTTATNSGTITASAVSAKGISVFSSASATNAAGATITASAADASAMYATGSGTKITNSGTLTVSGSADTEHNGAVGMFAGVGATATNSATINVTGDKSIGLWAQNGGIVINSGTTIELNSANTYGMYATGSGATATNSAGATITAKSDGSVGMYAENGNSITNSGVIEVSGATAYGMYAKSSGATATNNNSITVAGTETVGMLAEDGGSVTNASGGSIELNSADIYGMYAKGSGATATNASGATIKAKSDGSVGMYAESGNSVTSSGTIEVSGTTAYGMYATGSGATATNNNSITVSGADSVGIYAEEGAAATNATGKTINVTNNKSVGMYAKKATNAGGSVTNNGTIAVNTASITGNAYGMFATGSGAIAGNNKLITVVGTDSVAMYAEDGGSVTNASGGTIELNSADTYGLYALGSGATAINASGATIKAKSEGSVGMYAESGNSITNSGSVEVSGANAYGMYVSGSSATATNNSSISVSGTDSVGMYAEAGAKATNSATINVTGNKSVGLWAQSGGTVINNGTINVNASGAYGIFTTSGGSYSPSDGGNINAPDDQKICENCSAAAAAPMMMAAPKMFAVKNSGTIINNGIISTTLDVDFDEGNDGTGTISVGNGGSYVASSFSGTATADPSITLGGFENEYVNENSFVGEDKGLNITSGSYLFEAQKAANESGNIDVVMTKKDFAQVVEDASLANFLEENYADKNNESLFNELKSAGNSAQFNRNLDDLFGNDLLSDLTFADLNMLRELNFDMNNNLLAQQKGSFALTDGIEAVKGEKFGSAGQYALSGYNDGTTSVGVGLSVADTGNSKKKNGQNIKLNRSVMLSMPIARKAGGFELISSPKMGFSRGSYEREGLNGNSYNGMVERKTLALMNEARYPLKINGLKVVPNAEFNMIGYNVKAREDKKQYSLNVEAQNNYSVESGLGLNLEKEFVPYVDSKIKISGGVSVYKEFADPYDLKVSMNEMSGNYKLKDEKRGDKRTVLRFGAGYNVKENLDISAMIRTNIDREYRTETGVNLNYHF